MALTNSQYDAVMRIYSRRQAREARELENRRRDASAHVPELQELDREEGAVGAGMARHALEGKGTREDRERLHEIAQRREDLLLSHGYPADYLRMHYECSDCHDTGYIGAQRCHCLKQAQIDFLYAQSGLREIVKKENFSNFQLDYYPEDMINPSTGLSARETMTYIYNKCRDFADHFDEKDGNLFLYGGTGLGKTFLSHSIAAALLDTAHSVMYYSSADLFDQLAEEKFRPGNFEDAISSSGDLLRESDLLIIDDLGTEMVNSFVLSTLFSILNERMTRKKSIIISTNLTLHNFRDTYSDRIFSRISSGFELLGCYGHDIRFLRQFN